MNNKGLSVGGIVLVAVAIIVGIVFLVAIANQQAPLTNTYTVTNQTVTFPANGATLTLQGQALVGSLTAYNSSNFTDTVPTSNYTVTNYAQGTGGYRTVLTAKTSKFNSKSINVSYTYEPIGYNTGGASRSILGLVLVFFAIAVFALAIPDSREWLFSQFK